MANNWRIVNHWTAGASKPSAVDLKAYHFLIDRDGKTHDGRYRPEQNIPENGKLIAGEYAAHTKNANGWTIGVSMCGMFNAVAWDYGQFPLTIDQWETAVALNARLCYQYVIQPDRKTVVGHCEVEKLWGIKQEGKWDPWAPIPAWKTRIGEERDPITIGDLFRAEVTRALGRMRQS